MSGHYIEDEKLRRHVREQVRLAAESEVPGAQAQMRDIMDRAMEKLDRFVRNQDRAPELVTSTAAAEMLGMHVEHLARLRKRGEMPDPHIAASKGRDVALYLRSDIETLVDRRRQVAEQAAAEA